MVAIEEGLSAYVNEPEIISADQFACLCWQAPPPEIRAGMCYPYIRSVVGLVLILLLICHQKQLKQSKPPEFYTTVDLSDPELPVKLEAWQDYNNCSRPHSSLGNCTPWEAWLDKARNNFFIRGSFLRLR